VSDAARSESGLPIQPVYGGRPWTMRQYAGFGTARESNQRYHELVRAGTGGLSVGAKAAGFLAAGKFI
jgi:methylmalonyl-CoA mutase N-terminal domain/subunit